MRKNKRFSEFVPDMLGQFKKKIGVTILLAALMIPMEQVYSQVRLVQPVVKKQIDSLRRVMPGVKISWNPGLQVPYSISKIRSPQLEVTPQAVKTYFWENFRRFYQITNRNDVKAGKLQTLDKRFKKVSLYQVYQGIPVYGSMLNLSLNPKNQLISVTGKWLIIKDVNTTPRFPENQIGQAIIRYARQQSENSASWPANIQLEPDKTELVIFNPGIYKNTLERFYLCYKVRIKTEVFFVDASNGEVVLHLTNLQHARDRLTYNADCGEALSDPPGTLILDESGPVGGATPDTETQNAHDFAGEVYDYFDATHSRDSYDDAGGSIVSVVHSGVPVDPITLIICCLLDLDCCGCNHMNAAWIGPPYNRMVYGDGGTNGTVTFGPLTNGLDVIAHEITHGVTTYSIFDGGGDPIGIDYNGESGALNESFSDVFGAMVDRDDWLMGEDIVLAGYVSGALRNMADPTNGGLYDPSDAVGSAETGHQPDHYDNRYTGSSDNGGVHINSGIINKVAYLMAEGGTHPYSNISVTGMGKEVMEDIFYRMLTGHMTNTPTFLEARQAALTSVEELYPGDAAKYATVWNAFVACGICDPSVPGDCTPYAPIEARDPVDIVLTLDFSGSMNSPAEIGGRPKIDVLKDAVEIFLRTWEIFAVPGDQVDIVYFSSDVDPLSVSLQPFIGNVDALVSEVRGRSADGYTAMGGSMQVALNGLSGGSHPAVIAFTNGIQNVNPMAVDVGSHYEIINSTGAWGGTSSVPPNPGVSLGSYGIPIHTIAIGQAVGTSYHTLLDEIRTETGGLIHATNEPDTYLRQFYLEDLVQVLNLNTIEMVDYRRGNVNPGGTLNEEFLLDGGIKRAAFLVHWNEHESMGFRKFIISGPDGTVLSPTQWINGEFYSMAIFDFPYMIEKKLIDPVGKWRVYTSSPVNQNTPYQVTLLVDEIDIHYDFVVNPKSSWAGTPVTLTATLTEAGDKPITNLSLVNVSILKPNEPLGTVLSTTEGSSSGTFTDELANKEAIKLNNILKSAEVRKKLKPIGMTVELNDKGENGDAKSGDGIYSAVFNDTKEPGMYSFTFHTKGQTSTSWPFERTKTLGTNLKLNPSAHTILNVKWSEDNGKQYGTITVTPMDASGYYLGPGYENAIHVTLSDGKVTSIRDLVDGTYEVHVELDKPKEDVKMTLEISDVEIYKGPIADFDGKRYRFALSFHLGTTLPQGNFDANYDPGFLTEVDLEYKLSSTFSLEAVLGNYTFKKDYHVSGGGLYLKKYLPLTGIRLYGAAGAGLYKPKSSATRFGISGGIGLNKQVTPVIQGDVGAYYFNIFMPGTDIQFIGLKAGVKFLF